ncbi:MAG: TIGR02710 family CRISPR-associated CARF protein [bacterium]
MKTVLICTVGGSHQPIVQSITRNKPDFVHFICSEDSGKAKGSYTQVVDPGKVLKSDPNLKDPDLPNIVEITGLEEDNYRVHRIRAFDDLNECYLFALKLIEEIHEMNPDARIIADYTGGTKSMTAGLAAAALDDGRCEIQLVTGLRQNLNKVSDRTEFVRPVRVWDTQVTRRMKVAKELLSRFDYAGAASILEDAAARFASDNTIETLQRWLALCRAFDSWDSFDHATARNLLQPFRKNFVHHARFLDAIVKGKGAHGFEWVEDLLLNSDRRAVQGRFDDAVGRLYRALELTAQVWLRLRHGIDTGSVELDKVPDSVKESVKKHSDEKGIIRIGLVQAWEVIAACADDPLCLLFKEKQGVLLDFLRLRNYSLFAHGTTPIGERQYREHAPLVQSFIRCSVEKAVMSLRKKSASSPPQFPTEWD